MRVSRTLQVKESGFKGFKILIEAAQGCGLSGTSLYSCLLLLDLGQVSRVLLNLDDSCGLLGGR
jgi:hypothetical protein